MRSVFESSLRPVSTSFLSPNLSTSTETFEPVCARFTTTSKYFSRFAGTTSESFEPSAVAELHTVMFSAFA